MNSDMDTKAQLAGVARQYVTFFVDGEAFAVALSEVKEIIRMPGLVRLPLSPASIEGLANLRGSVLPIVSARHMFGQEDIAHDDATRVVILDRGRPVGLVVDRMANVVTVDDDHRYRHAERRDQGCRGPRHGHDPRCRPAAGA